jgi:hypothetical protein
MRKIWDYMTWFPAGLYAWLAAIRPAWAQGTAGIDEKTAEETASKLVDLLNGVIQPIGALVIFVAIAWTAFRLIVTANKHPQERAEALSAIPYILGGGIVLGGAMLLAGFIVGLMVEAGK